MQRQMIAAVLAGTMLVAGCSASGEKAAEGNDMADTQAAAEAIRAAEAQWNRDYAARNVEAIMAHYAADGTLSGPGDNPRTGTERIREAVTQMVGDPAFRLEFAQDNLQVANSGELAFTRGHFTLNMTNPRTRAPAVMRGTYLTVWRKQADGRWQAVEDMITPGPGA